ncbi:ribulose-phosphate 3-epimerase [Rapidithrix thailandica]|uniref:Ribulose-phosphate 3-epimerase n=1 Tax=Rapidithrix thailandica TaxID=413964 RepID=A0AAW9RWT2_9BACT
MKSIVAPSILAADFNNLQRDIEMVNESEADLIHFDVMDGTFVPNISFGIPVLEAVNKIAKKPIDVHLMIVNPEQHLEAFKNAGADYISVHYETCPHLHRTVYQIKELGCKAGVVLNPHTPVSLLEGVITDVDFVLLMSVNPGFGGQKFIPHTYQKVKDLKKMIRESGSKALIEIDGGVDASNAKALVEAGADMLVAGSYVFKHPQPKEAISSIKHLS